MNNTGRTGQPKSKPAAMLVVLAGKLGIENADTLSAQELADRVKRAARQRREQQADGGYSSGKSIDTFCLDWGISRSFYYKMRARGTAPVVVEIDGVQRITPAAERAWAKAGEKRGRESAKRDRKDRAA